MLGKKLEKKEGNDRGAGIESPLDQGARARGGGRISRQKGLSWPEERKTVMGRPASITPTRRQTRKPRAKIKFSNLVEGCRGRQV